MSEPGSEPGSASTAEGKVTVSPGGEHDLTGAASTGGTHLTPSSVTPGALATRAGTDMFGAAFGSDTSGFGGLVERKAALVSSPKPYGGWFDEATDALESAWPGFADQVLRVVVAFGELTIHVKPEAVLDIARVLRDEPSLRFELLSSVSGADYPN